VWVWIVGAVLLPLIFCGGCIGLIASAEPPEDEPRSQATTTTEAEQTTTTEREADEDEPTTTTEPEPTTTTAPPETVSQSNARESAASYLEYSSFSRSGLIDQLMFEGFSEADATYGVDSNQVDWNEQAALSAASYLEYSSFSRSGLVEQLVFEGFTPEEAEYGVSTTGL